MVCTQVKGACSKDFLYVGQRTVFVQVTFLKIGEIDTKKECFDADVLVCARWREPDLDRFTGENMTSVSTARVTSSDKGSARK